MDGHVRKRSYYLLLFPNAAVSKTVMLTMKTLLVQSTSSKKEGQHSYQSLRPFSRNFPRFSEQFFPKLIKSNELKVTL